jgi:uncharacterized protein (DUF111 family)
VLQVVLGRAVDATGAATDALVTSGHQVVLLETNVDDATGEVLAHAVTGLLAAGAHDAWITPVIMKKGRPAHLVSALCDAALADEIAQVLMSETGTLGVRGQTLSRWLAARSLHEVEIDGYPVRVKVSPGRVKAEYDDASRVARRLGRPLREVASLAEAEARRRAQRADHPSVEPSPTAGPPDGEAG